MAQIVEAKAIRTLVVAPIVVTETAWKTSATFLPLCNWSPLIPAELLEQFNHQVRAQIAGDLINCELTVVATAPRTSAAVSEKKINIAFRDVPLAIQYAGITGAKRVVSGVRNISEVFGRSLDAVLAVFGRRVDSGATAFAENVTMFLYLGEGEVPRR